MRDIIDILKSLVEIDSSNPPGNETYIVNYIMSHFKDYEYMKVICHCENRASLIIDVPGESNELVVVVGHLDTVPATNLSQWQSNPFNPVIINNKMYGRGTSDMKSGIACMINVAKYFIYNYIKPKKTVRFMFTADEESSGIGIRSLIDLGYLNNAKYLLIPETSDESIVIKEKGALWLKIKVHGKPSHGSTPELGINAIEKLYELIYNIKPIIDNNDTDNLLGKNSIAINKIQGGTRTNITADYCEAEIDIRTIPNLKFTHETIINQFYKIINDLKSKYEGLEIYLEVLNNRIPIMTDENNELVKSIRGVMSSLGYCVDIKGVKFFTDGSIILSKYDMPFAIYGPGIIEQCHVDNEYVLLDSLERVQNVYIELLKCL